MPTEYSLQAKVYAALKERILGGGFAFRERMDISALAREVRASATPVRLALVRLADERLVTVSRQGAFYVAAWSADELRALYEWRGILAVAALDHAKPGAAGLTAAQSVTQMVDALFAALAANANSNLVRAATSADERLWAARRVEPLVFAGLSGDLLRIGGLLDSGQTRRARSALQRYFDRSAGAAAEIRAQAFLAALPRNGA